MKKEWIDYISIHEKLETGNAMATDSGNLHLKRIIHAVGPKYNKGGLDNTHAINQMKSVTESKNLI